MPTIKTYSKGAPFYNALIRQVTRQFETFIHGVPFEEGF
jgi:hypothetical protein